MLWHILSSELSLPLCLACRCHDFLRGTPTAGNLFASTIILAGSSMAGSILVSVSWRRRSAESPSGRLIPRYAGGVDQKKSPGHAERKHNELPVNHRRPRDAGRSSGGGATSSLRGRSHRGRAREFRSLRSALTVAASHGESPFSAGRRVHPTTCRRSGSYLHKPWAIRLHLPARHHRAVQVDAPESVSEMS